MDTLLPSQPGSYKQLLKSSFLLYRASYKRIILLALLLSIITFIPRLLADIIGQDIFAGLKPLNPERLWFMLIDLSGLLFFIAILWRMHCVIRNKHEPFAEDLYVGIRKLFYAAVACILQSAIIFAVSVLCFGTMLLLHQHHILVPEQSLGFWLIYVIITTQFMLVLYISTLFLFFIPLIAIENKGILSSLQSSIYLGWNHWWRIFSLQCTPWICYVLLLLFIRYTLTIDIHIYFMKQEVYSLWATLLHIVLFALFIPWVAALLLTQLKDLELRKHIVTTE